MAAVDPECVEHWRAIMCPRILQRIAEADPDRWKYSNSVELTLEQIEMLRIEKEIRVDGVLIRLKTGL